MNVIRIIDNAGQVGHALLSYAAPDAERSFWTGQFPVAGVVQAYMCQSCGRIALYGNASGQ